MNRHAANTLCFLVAMGVVIFLACQATPWWTFAATGLCFGIVHEGKDKDA